MLYFAVFNKTDIQLDFEIKQKKANSTGNVQSNSQIVMTGLLKISSLNVTPSIKKGKYKAVIKTFQISTIHIILILNNLEPSIKTLGKKINFLSS